MKKVILVTLSTPTINNVKTASALPYHLIFGAKKNEDIDIEIYTFNINDIPIDNLRIENENFNISVKLLDMPLWMKTIFRYRLLFLRLFLKKPLLSYCKLPKCIIESVIQTNPDILWIYGEEIAGLASHFPQVKCIVTMPDCESLYYYRMIGLSWNNRSLRKLLRYTFAYWQYGRMERMNNLSHVKYHFVGKADADFYRSSNPNSNVRYLPHPHYDYKDRVISFHKPKIKVLFAGRYDLYCKHGSDMVLNALISHANDFRKEYEITFLGKDWDVWKNKLDDAGYKVNHINYAPDYIEELHQHDIQINAIDVGTGTKGKVLDAFANGLLVIGTPFALENIETDNSSSIRFSTPDEFVATLYDIPRNILKYEQMAEFGRKNIIKHHDRHIISKQLFN